MQRVVWNAALAHVRDYPITRPVIERIHFDELITVLDRSGDDRRAVALFCTQPGNPRGSASESTRERLDLTNRAAGMPRLDGGSKAVHTLARDKCFEPFVIGVQGSDAPTIASFGIDPELVGLGKEAASVETGNFDLEVLGEDGIRDGLVLDAKTGCEHDSAHDLSARHRKAMRQVKSRECVQDSQNLMLHSTRGPQSCPQSGEQGRSKRPLLFCEQYENGLGRTFG